MSEAAVEASLPDAVAVADEDGEGDGVSRTVGARPTDD
jgi:hypothetical protein